MHLALSAVHSAMACGSYSLDLCDNLRVMMRHLDAAALEKASFVVEAVHCRKHKVWMALRMVAGVEENRSQVELAAVEKESIGPVSDLARARVVGFLAKEKKWRMAKQ